jgi:hypothetical protein
MWSPSFLSLGVLLIMAIHKSSAIPPLPTNIFFETTTCNDANEETIAGAFNDMVNMAEVAYDRTVAAMLLSSSPSDRLVVLFTFQTYFSLFTEEGIENRKAVLLRRHFWMAVFGIMRLMSWL